MIQHACMGNKSARMPAKLWLIILCVCSGYNTFSYSRLMSKNIASHFSVKC